MNIKNLDEANRLREAIQVTKAQLEGLVHATVLQVTPVEETPGNYTPTKHYEAIFLPVEYADIIKSKVQDELRSLELSVQALE